MRPSPGHPFHLGPFVEGGGGADRERGRAEDALGLYFEQGLQAWYLDLPASGWIGFWNVFYGTAHFIVTAVALIWLYRRDKARYPTWRNTLAFTTLFALVGFASFSLMPPRLLDETFDRFGPPVADNDEGAEHGDMVDTLATYPTFWSFDSGTLKNISNQYAAMPSLHIGWSTWSALVMAPMLRRRRSKVLVWPTFRSVRRAPVRRELTRGRGGPRSSPGRGPRCSRR